MDSRTGPERPGSLVVELAARTVLVDGIRVELPPTEFSLLAVLAARPGELVTHKELLDEAFGDSAYMNTQDLHWRMWNIRKLIGDEDKTLIRNRRGQGFILEASRVEILDGLADPNDVHTSQAATESVIKLDEEEPPGPIEPEPTAAATPKTDDESRRRFVLSPVVLLILGLVACLALGGSWLAGYTLSQRGVPATTDRKPDQAPQPDEVSEQTRGRGKGSRNKPSRKNNEGGGRDPVGAAPAAPVGASDVTSGNAGTGGQSAGSASSGAGSDSGNKQQKPTPPPPQPDAQLYHLFHPESGDHIVTTSSSLANQKQAEGYQSSLEGGVFSAQQEGTVAITLDSGNAYIYANSSAAPDGARVTALYKLSNGTDFFYTKSSSTANQAQAQGWSRSTAGYVMA